MTKTIFSKVMWVGRATVFLVGLAVILALVFGVATTALGANGNPFLLGRFNAATALTKLTGNVNGAAMQVVNSNTGTNDTALNLSVQAGEAPMTVNSNRKVANLNADRIDDREASSFANGVGGVATNADKLDNLDSADFQRTNAAAGGDLSGTYPNPNLANGVVEPANVGAIPTARVRPNFTQSAPDNSPMILAFNSEEHDVGNLHDNVTNNTRLTAPIDGVYAISAMVPFGADPDGPDGTRIIRLTKNASPDAILGATPLDSFQGPPLNSTSLATDQSLSTQAKLSAGDYVEVLVKQDNADGDALSIFSRAHFEMTWIAPG